MSATRPNVLLLFTDQHRADLLGCEGHPDALTPNLDALAARGTRFTRAYCQDAVCVPSRCSLFSGLYPRTLGCLANGDRTPAMASVVPLQQALRAGGYHTAAFGKRHLYQGCDSGWDQAVSHLPDESADQYLAWIEALGHGEDFARDWGAEWGWAPPGSIREGQDRPRAPLSAQASRLAPDQTMEAYTQQLTSAYLRDRAADGHPFFCWASFVRPHQPYTPPAEYLARFDASHWGHGTRAGDGLLRPANFDQPAAALPPALHAQREARGGTWCLQRAHDDEAIFRQALACYYAGVLEVDTCIGQILATLAATGLDRNTIVIYTSDHGEFAGNHGMMEKCAWGHNVFEDTLRVPLIVSWPTQFRQRAVCQDLAELVDLYPTLLELCGGRGAMPLPALPGRSLAATLQQGTPVGRSYSVSENWSQATIIAPRYKLALWLDPGPTAAERDYRAFGHLLFDRETDPGEVNNLYGQPALAGIRDELWDQLLAWCRATPAAGHGRLPQRVLEQP